MDKKAYIGLAAAALLAVGAGTVTAAGDADQGGPAAAEVRAVDTPLPHGARDLATGDGAIAKFAVDVSKAQGYELANSDRTVWIAPGEDGSICLFDDGPGATCSPDDGGDNGLTVAFLPQPSPEYLEAVLEVQQRGLEGDAAVEALREATAQLAPSSGPATYIGYVPSRLGISSVRLLDAEGGEIARTQPRYGIYDFRVADVSTEAPATIELNRDGGAAPITIGPLAGPPK